MRQFVTLPQVKDNVVNRALTTVSNAINPGLTSALSGGVLLSRVVLAVGDNSIPHGLGRAWTGYIVTRTYARTLRVVLSDAPAVADVTKALCVYTSVAGTVDIFVF